jgi:serine/threonine protein kinase/Tol biopolymer transport system component
MSAVPSEDEMAGQAGRTLRPEDEISHYRVVSPLGAGGMGEVYLAQDRTLERNVALKVLPPDLVRNEDRVRRFELEARSASQLSHPNIVTIYEIGRDAVRSTGRPDSDPVHYISMELVSGKTLATLIHEDKTDLRTLLGYLAQAAEGLSKAHAAGIVHRDLKPGNIMVSADGFTKVLDFGLAKLTEKREGAPDISEAPTLAADGSAVGSVVGTAGYMSPEQVAGRSVDHRSDIFSFGCILYEAATRRKPFAAETGIETMHKILNEKPVPVEEINDQVPAELRRLIRRCLAKSPDQRVQSIKDLAIELREVVEEYDTLSVSGSSTTQASGAALAAKPSRKLGLPTLVAAGLIAVAGLAVGWWGLRRGARESGAVPFQSMRMSTQTSRGDVLDAVISPDGRYLAYLAGAAGRASLRVRQVATGSDVEVLPAKDAALEMPAFSPDGNYLFYLTRKPDNPSYRALFQIPSLGGAPRERVFDVDSRVSFSPDGREIAFWRGVPQKREARLVAFDLEAARERDVTTVAEPEVNQGAAAWSPDGGTIAVLLLKPAPDLETTVAFFDAQSGARRDFLKLPRTILTSLAWLPDGRGLVASGQELRTAINDQVFLISHPEARLQRVTNDFNRYLGVSVSGGEEAIAALRVTRLANLWAADTEGGPARQITSTANPEDSPFGLAVTGSGSLLFGKPRDEKLQIWAIDPAGGETRALTSGNAHSVGAVAAGDVVVFDRLDASGVHIWRMSPEGSDVRQLTSGAGEQVAALSPDGRWVAFAPYDAPRTVSLVSAESGKVTAVASSTAGVVGFSPDGTKLLVAQLESDVQGLVRTVFSAFAVPGGGPGASFRLPATAMDPAWSPDGRGLTFRNRSDPAWNVQRQDEGAASPVAVTRFAEGRLLAHSWSPDGTRLAVIHRTEAGSNVWVTGPDGARPFQVTQMSSMDVFSVRWLPDSRRLAVQAGKLSRDVVLIRSFR